VNFAGGIKGVGSLIFLLMLFSILKNDIS